MKPWKIALALIAGFALGSGICITFAGTEITPGQGVAAGAGATDGRTQRVVLASDSPGATSTSDASAANQAIANALIADANTTLTAINGKITACNTGAVAGTVTANLGTTDTASLTAIKGAVGNVAVAKNTWVSIAAVLGRLCVLSGTTVTVSNTTTGTLYGSSDGGTSAWVLVDFAGDPIQKRVLTANDANDTISANYQTSVGFVKGLATSVKWAQSAAGTDNWTFRAIGQ